ncbi:MAG: sulfatase, partial [Flavobacteriaceae bacterium]
MNTPNRTRVSLVLLMGLLFAACTSPTSPQQPPNIVFIMSDDHAYQAISAYSDKLIETPNIDRIAQQ